MRALTKLLAVLLASSLAVSAQSTQPDLTKEPTLYVVAYSHLDTQWRWEYPRVINEYIPKTLHDNFALLDKYPNYVFNFSGANRYRMMKEYWPADYARLKQYVAAGRWFPAGSSMEEGDVNVPSAESIFRQILYGNRFFQREFGKTSAEYMLPDCFGFPASLPSILAHAGLKGFSTQKLTWNSAAQCWWPRFDRRNAARNSMECRLLAGTGRSRSRRRTESRKLRRSDQGRHQQESSQCGSKRAKQSGRLAASRRS